MRMLNLDLARGKKSPSASELVGAHMEKRVPEPATSFWAAGGREEAFSCKGSEGNGSVSHPGPRAVFG